MGTRKHDRYVEPNDSAWHNNSWVTGEADANLANACVATYAETRRNVACFTANTSGVIALTIADTDSWMRIIKVPIQHRITPGYTLRVNVRYSLSSESAGDTVELIARAAGINSDIAAISSPSSTWQELDIAIPAGLNIHPFHHLVLTARTRGANTITIETIQADQIGTATPTWVDIDAASTKLGDDDWPESAASMKMTRDAIVAVRNARTVKSNVFCHWYRDYTKTGSYGAGTNELGVYRFRKRRGVQYLTVHMLLHSDDDTHDYEVTATMSDSSEGSDTLNYTGSAGGEPEWDSLTFSFTGSDITDELEIDLSIDAEDHGAYGMTMSICAVCVVEKHIDTGITHTVPDVPDYMADTTINSSDIENMRKTAQHLWECGGCAIAMQDWRFGSTANSYDERLYLNKNSIDKQHYGPSSTSIAARLLAFPSTSSVKWRITMSAEVAAGSTVTKYIEFQASDSMTAGTYDDAGPLDTSNKYYAWVDEYDGEKVYGCYLAVTSGDWETPAAELSPGNTPMQLWAFGWISSGGSEYIKPKWICVEEMPLEFTEFP